MRRCTTLLAGCCNVSTRAIDGLPGLGCDRTVRPHRQSLGITSVGGWAAAVVSRRMGLSRRSGDRRRILTRGRLLRSIIRVHRVVRRRHFTRYGPVLFTVMGGDPGRRPCVRHLIRNLLSAIVTDLDLFRHGGVSARVLNFLGLSTGTMGRFGVPRAAPRNETGLISRTVSRLSRFLMSVRVSVHSRRNVFGSLGGRNRTVSVGRIGPALRGFISQRTVLFLGRSLSGRRRSRTSTHLCRR